ncbi:MAG: polymer-forming cytoskeletal protein, partial [Planctomycetota bacterium]
LHAADASRSLDCPYCGSAVISPELNAANKYNYEESSPRGSAASPEPPRVQSTTLPPPVVGTSAPHTPRPRKKNPVLGVVGLGCFLLVFLFLFSGLRKGAASILRAFAFVASESSSDARTHRSTRDSRNSEPITLMPTERETNQEDYDLAARWLNHFSSDSAAENVKQYLDEQGFVLCDQDFWNIDGPATIEDKLILHSQVVRLEVDCSTDLVVFAQSCDLEGEVHGDLYFGGQVLTLERGALVHGDVHILGAQVAFIKGTVQGNLTDLASRYEASIPGDGNIQGEILSSSPITESTQEPVAKESATD